MCYLGLKTLLKKKHKTWTDFLVETNLKPDILKRSLSNDYTEQELKIISEYFNVDYSEIFSYNPIEEEQKTQTNVGIKDFRLSVNIDKLLKKILIATKNSELIWTNILNLNKYLTNLPIVPMNSVSLVDLNAVKFKDVNTKVQECFYSEYKNQKYVIRKLKDDEIIFNLISENEIVTYNTQNGVLVNLLYAIKISNGVFMNGYY